MADDFDRLAGVGRRGRTGADADATGCTPALAVGAGGVASTEGAAEAIGAPNGTARSGASMACTSHQLTPALARATTARIIHPASGAGGGGSGNVSRIGSADAGGSAASGARNGTTREGARHPSGNG
jgi:hypothetical protein